MDIYNKKDSIQKLIELQQKQKFDEETTLLYPGLENIEMKEIISITLNKSIDEFIVLIRNNSSVKDFQNAILKGLNSFNSFSLDTEDRERLCHYYEEIMDCIGLESSGGVINKWMYGFEIE